MDGEHTCDDCGCYVGDPDNSLCDECNEIYEAQWDAMQDDAL